MKASQRALDVLQILAYRYPQAGFGTQMDDDFHTLIATLLSAQTTDKQVLKIYPAFRERFPDAPSLARASVAEIESYVKTVGLYRTKARNIKRLAETLGDAPVPRTMEGLIALPGVGRKTASVVLACCFATPAIAVDTHVHRVANRLGLVRTKVPTQTEKRLLALVPRERWSEVNRVLVPFGREVCSARSPKCPTCPIAHLCPYTKKTKPTV